METSNPRLGSVDPLEASEDEIITTVESKIIQ